MNDFDSTFDNFLARLDEVNKRRKIDPAFDKKMRSREKAERKILYPGMTEGQIRKSWDLTWRLREAEEQGLVTIDTRGHRISDPLTISDKIPHSPNSVKAVARIFRALEKGTSMRKVAILYTGNTNNCYLCDYGVSYRTIDGLNFHATGECPLSEGIDLEFELNVPSGKMVVSDELQGFKALGDFDVNKLVGRLKLTRKMEDMGCAHAFVGNTCPSMYKIGEDQYAIGNPGQNESDELRQFPGEEVASICTDLWWYSIADYDEYLRRSSKIDRDVDVVDVKPGVYKFTHHGYRLDLKDDPESDEPTIYTDIEWVRPPDEVRDFRAEYLKLDYTAGQIIHRSMTEYPDLHHGPDAVQGVANDIFCVIGGSGSWHKNGFVLFDPYTPAREPEVEIPTFSKQYWWYPLSDRYSALALAAKGKINLNSTFASLAKNILRCMLEYGFKPSSEREEVPNSEQIQGYLDAIEARYPNG